MNRITYISILCLGALVGCQSTQSLISKVNSGNVLKQQGEVETPAEIEANSKKFLAEIKEQASDSQAEVELLIRQGQQEVVSWYQDQDDRHISAAKKHFREALKRQPKQNVEALHGLAVVADLEKNFAVAEQHYQLALAQSPSDSNILGNLGYSYLLQNRLEESERYLLRATQIDPENMDATKHLGDVYTKLGQPDKAMAVLTRVMNPQEAQRVIASHGPPSSRLQQQESLAGRFSTPGNASAQGAQINTANYSTVDRPQSHIQSMTEFHNSATGFQFPNKSSAHLSEGELKRRLAEIDQERNRGISQGPVMIQTETRLVHPTVNHASNASVASNAPQNLTQQHLQSQQRQRSSERDQGQRSISLSQFGVPDNQYAEMSPYQQQRFLEAQRQRHLRGTVHMRDQQLQAATGMEQENHSAYLRSQQQNDPLRKPWGGNGTQQANYEQSMMMEPYPGPQHQDFQIDSSQQFHSQRDQGSQTQLQHGNDQHSQARNQTTHYPRHINQIPQTNYARPIEGIESEYNHTQQQYSGQQLHQSQQQLNAATPVNPQEEARMQAAKLGMGMGPGNMFSSMNENAHSQRPGHQSHWNGGSYPQPERMLPTNVPPVDFSQQQPPAYGVPNSQGQQVPGSQVVNDHGQFGTASPFDAELHGNRNISNQFLESQRQVQLQNQRLQQQLAAQRAGAHQQLNEQTASYQTQRPLQLHQPNLNRPHIASPAEYGGMVPHQPQHEGNIAPYPFSHRETNSVIPPPGSPRVPTPSDPNQTRYYDDFRGSRIVEPPPYRSSNTNNPPGPDQQQSRNYQGGQIQQMSYSTEESQQNTAYPYSSSNSHSSSSMPMIIPGSN